MISLPRVLLFGLYAYLLNITVITLLYAGTDLIRSACEMYVCDGIQNYGFPRLN